jgi:hypothetical protein
MPGGEPRSGTPDRAPSQETARFEGGDRADVDDDPLDDDDSQDEDSQDEGSDGYRKGGYHRVAVGDTFKDGRYLVLSKLGWGHFSTVWLSLDNHTQQQVALKVRRRACVSVGGHSGEEAPAANEDTGGRAQPWLSVLIHSATSPCGLCRSRRVPVTTRRRPTTK